MGSISKRLKSLIQSNQSVDPRDSIDPIKSDSNGLSPEAVKWAYRLYLDREPEREQVVEEHLRKCASTEELRANFIYSTEFREKNPTLHVPVLLGNEPPMSIEHTCSDEVLQSLFDHVQSIWQELGKTEPHWSVVISEQYRQSNLQANKDAFYQTGRQHVDQLFGSFERNHVDYSGFKTCLDYGCGVGRITRHLAERFERVFACDISRSHLQCMDQYLIEENVSNVSLHHLKRVRDVEELPKVDVAFSILVLQHNPPPVIGFLVEALIRSLSPGGVAFLQVPTYRLGYTFSVADYLAEQVSQGVEMHVLPQRMIFEIVQSAGARVLEVIDDNWTGLRYKEVSNTFVIQK